MNSIEFEAIAHDGVLDIPDEHQRALDGRSVRVVLVDEQTQTAGGAESIFSRLRRVRVQGPVDLSEAHDEYVTGRRDD